MTEQFSPEERTALSPYVTNLDGPVFALVNLPEVVKGALFARYSRSPKSLRRLYLEQSTRYIPYDDLVAGRYRYHVPRELEGDLHTRYVETLDAMFDTYRALLPVLRQHFTERFPRGRRRRRPHIGRASAPRRSTR